MIKLRTPFLNKNDFKITQGFGDNPEVYQRFGLPAHNGIDFACKEGTRIVSCQKGVVVKSEKHPSYGNIVKIKHNEGFLTLYCHLKKRLVIKGETIKEGDIIGLSGNTGFSTGPHLHFGLQSLSGGTTPYNYYIDPALGFIAASKDKKKTKKKVVKIESNDQEFASSIEKIEGKTKIDNKYQFKKNVNYGSKSKEVIELQKRLKKEGFFTYPYFTEYYGPVTKQAVLKYQLARGIVRSPYDTGAGRLGPGTRASLNRS